MSNGDWKKIRPYQHAALPDVAFDLEIHQGTLEFRVQVQGQTFTSKDGNEVLRQARDYLLSLPVAGLWQPMIELVHYNRRVEANRQYIRIEKDGAIVQHPWVQASGDIEIARITELRYHTSAYDRSHKKVPPCVHHDGLSSYYHLPYSLEVWGCVQALASTCNNFFARLSAFLNTVSAPMPNVAWEAHFLEQWQQLSFFEEAPNMIEE